MDLCRQKQFLFTRKPTDFILETALTSDKKVEFLAQKLGDLP